MPPTITDYDSKPFLKWVGGKRQLLPELLRHVPPKFGRYFEPFLGGGALFFALRPTNALLNDKNMRLMRTYKSIRYDVEAVIQLLCKYPYQSEFFYSMRKKDIDAASDTEVAAWFIYLNKSGFNGLYRVNKQNCFNVPFGRHSKPTICDVCTLRACSNALDHAELMSLDFETAVSNARKGDFVYFDPPYVPITATSNFTSYTLDGFGLEDQKRLRNTALKLKNKGVHVLLSNSATPLVRELYRGGFEVIEVKAKRRVNRNASGRGEISELIIK